MIDLFQSLEYEDLNNLKVANANLRTPNRSQRGKLKSAIKQFGFIGAIIVDENNHILAGVARYHAARELDMDKVPVIRLSHLSEANKRAYRIADNRIAELSGWNKYELGLELDALSLEFPDLALEVTGFDLPEIEFLAGETKDKSDAEPKLVETNPDYAATKPGTLWQLGDHLLICGDARDETVFHKLLKEDKAQTIFADPPYNVPIQGYAGGKGSIKHREFACAVGEMSEAEFTCFLQIIFANLAKYSLDGSIHYLCMDWKHLPEILTAAGSIYDQWLNLIVWNKTNAGMGSLYRSQHELVLAYRKGTAAHVNNVQLGKYGRNRSNVWTYPGVNSIGSEHRKDLALHPTVKPTQMVADAILDCSNKGDIVLDAFGGSGSTLLAAEQTGRRARLVELDPGYCDVTIKRWEEMTGRQAVNLDTSRTFFGETQIAECEWRLTNVKVA